MKQFFLALVLGWGVAGGVLAGDLHGVVSHVTDGDSLWVRPSRGGEPVEVRLLHLDAPEGCQRHGREAGAALKARVLHQPVLLRTRGYDDYGRMLARLEHRGVDVGEWLVAQGHAWSSGFRRSPGPYAARQAEARRQRRGLWAEARPVEPKTFRKRHGRCQRGEQAT